MLNKFSLIADVSCQVFFTVTFLGMAAGMAGAVAPDIAKGKPALISIFKLIDQVADCEKSKRLRASTTPTGAKDRC